MVKNRIIREIEKLLNTDESNNTLKMLTKIKSLEKKIKTIDEKDPWEIVQIARSSKRPHTLDYIRMIFKDFIELHGDRLYGDDQAIIGGIASFNGIPVTVIGHQKGRKVEESLKRNFGMPNPEGYRKALRLMKQAEKFSRPIITFIDTPGAYPGVGAEERGQGEAIAKNLYEMSGLTVPVISFVIGEGGSGGALALGVANRVYMLENSIYSILSPEGYASILYKDGTKAKEAAKKMKLTAKELLELKLIDGIIKEPLVGAEKYPYYVAQNIHKQILEALKEFKMKSKIELKAQRYKKYRVIGEFDRYVK